MLLLLGLGKKISQVYFNFRNTKFEVTHTGFMAVDNNLRISVEILKLYASGFSSLIIEGPNNDFPTKITSNWPWICAKGIRLCAC